MKSVLLGALAFACAIPVAAHAAEISDPRAALAECYRTAMSDARWTGSMLSSNAGTLPKGRFYTEPYFFDVITGGNHYPGSSGFYQYGLIEGFTVGLQPRFSVGTKNPNREFTVGDLKLLSQLRLTQFTPERRIPARADAIARLSPGLRLIDSVYVVAGGPEKGSSNADAYLNLLATAERKLTNADKLGIKPANATVPRLRDEQD